MHLNWTQELKSKRKFPFFVKRFATITLILCSNVLKLDKSVNFRHRQEAVILCQKETK